MASLAASFPAFSKCSFKCSKQQEMFLDEVNAITSAEAATVSELWRFLPFGYLLTIAIETPILLAGLAREITFRQRLLCGVWLSACTYPIVVLVLPSVLNGSSRPAYLLVAETFAPVAECLLFWLAFRSVAALRTGGWIRSFIAIVAANLASFGFGELLNAYGWFGLF
jgi:hypothetical protein